MSTSSEFSSVVDAESEAQLRAAGTGHDHYVIDVFYNEGDVIGHLFVVDAEGMSRWNTDAGVDGWVVRELYEATADRYSEV